LSFSELLEVRGVLVADGATGTNYQDLGLEPGVAPEEWVFDRPDLVLGLHRAFIDAGSDVILTCTFGATGLRLADSPLAGRAFEVNERAAELAREAGSGRVLVAGSLGPTGQLCEPLGTLTLGDCAQAYEEQARGLAAGGVDLLVLETFFAIEEATAALEGIRRATDLPVVVTFSFDQGTRTMMGVSPGQAVAAVREFELAAVGANCGRSLADNDTVVEELLEAANGLPLWVKPNAGVPKVVGDAVLYDADPDKLALHARRYVEEGVRIVGGCCGSTPAHLEAIARAVRGTAQRLS
jgi:5-methyltetrahydrofolate--homocysteine methyltransferase